MYSVPFELVADREAVPMRRGVLPTEGGDLRERTDADEVAAVLALGDQQEPTFPRLLEPREAVTFGPRGRHMPQQVRDALAKPRGVDACEARPPSTTSRNRHLALQNNMRNAARASTRQGGKRGNRPRDTCRFEPSGIVGTAVKAHTCA